VKYLIEIIFLFLVLFSLLNHKCNDTEEDVIEDTDKQNVFIGIDMNGIKLTNSTIRLAKKTTVFDTRLELNKHYSASFVTKLMEKLSKIPERVKANSSTD
jgi:hypothetical protein